MGTLAVHSTQHLDCRGTASGDIIITLYRRLSCLECLVSYRLNVEVRGLEILMYLHTCNLVPATFTHSVFCFLWNTAISTVQISYDFLSKRQFFVSVLETMCNVLQVISTTIFSVLAGRWAGWAVNCFKVSESINSDVRGFLWSPWPLHNFFK